MIIETLSTFPCMYDSVMNSSMMRIAQEKGILDFHAYDLRDWTHDRHRTTDDDPYGGGAGLVMKCEPLFEAYDEICSSGEGRDFGSCPERADWAASTKRVPHEPEVPSGTSARAGLPSDWAPPEQPAAPQSDCPKPCTIFLAPQGERFCDETALELAKEERLLFICGHYEGIDERAYTLADRVISLGDYVLTSGELAAMVVIDAVVRKLPGVLGAEDGAITESFSDGLWSIPSTRVLPSSAECGFPTCFSRETTGRWRNGAASRACCVLPACAPTCLPTWSFHPLTGIFCKDWAKRANVSREALSFEFTT